MHSAAYISERSSEGLMVSLGLAHYHVRDEREFIRTLRTLIKQQTAIIFVSETVFETYQEIIDSHNHDVMVSIIVLSNQGKQGTQGQKRMRRLIEDAVGLSIE